LLPAAYKTIWQVDTYDAQEQEFTIAAGQQYTDDNSLLAYFSAKNYNSTNTAIWRPMAGQLKDTLSF
jgi:hypothetical protein